MLILLELNPDINYEDDNDNDDADDAADDDDDYADDDEYDIFFLSRMII